MELDQNAKLSALIKWALINKETPKNPINPYLASVLEYFVSKTREIQEESVDAISRQNLSPLLVSKIVEMGHNPASLVIDNFQPIHTPSDDLEALAYLLDARYHLPDSRRGRILEATLESHQYPTGTMSINRVPKFMTLHFGRIKELDLHDTNEIFNPWPNVVNKYQQKYGYRPWVIGGYSWPLDFTITNFEGPDGYVVPTNLVGRIHAQVMTVIELPFKKMAKPWVLGIYTTYGRSWRNESLTYRQDFRKAMQELS